MFKKLLSFAAIAAVCIGARAEKVVDAYIDYSTWTEWNLYEMGYSPVIADGVLKSSNPLDEETGEYTAWYQYFMFPAFAANIDQTYDITFKVKGSVDGEVNIQVRWSWSEDPINQTIPVTTDWAEVTATFPEVGGQNCDVIFQSGAYVGDIEWAWAKVEHEQGEVKPIEWINLLDNGDASKDWENPDMAFNDPLNYTICAWAKTNATDPVPAPIEVVDGDRVFVVHAGDCVTEGDAAAWDNQFWIEAPQSFSTGDIFKVSFRYKASQNANTNTQAHKQNPSDYLHWQLMGDVAFTTDWQSIAKEVTVGTEQNGMWSVAFNLNPAVKSATDFYYDDLKIEVMKLDEGYFVAGDFNDKNLDEAVQMALNEDEVYAVCIGTAEKPASQFKISTKRGNDNAFHANALKIDDTLIVNDQDTWIDFEAGGTKWSTLPEAGIWTILLDEDYQQVAFYMGESGIASPISDNAPAVYYNLQGVQVQNPSNGIYLVKRGAKVTKQVIR